VTRSAAWDACIALDSSSQLVIIKPVYVNGAWSDGESENDFVAQVANTLTDFWTAGLREGWEVEDPSLYPNEDIYNDGVAAPDTRYYINQSYDAYENWNGGSQANAGWGTSSLVALVVQDLSHSKEWQMTSIDSNSLHSYVCEKPLQTCTTELTQERTTWAATTIGVTATSVCPTGHVGNQTRECEITAVFRQAQNFYCYAEIVDAGWVDDVYDGFAWENRNFHTNNNTALGPMDSATTNTKNFYAGTVDIEQYPYMSIDFLAYPISGWNGEVTVFLNGAEVRPMTFSENSTYHQVVGRELFGLEDYFNLTIVSEMTGATGTESFYFTNFALTPYTRQMMSEDCFRKMSFNESTANPVFNQGSSGFLSASDDLTFDFTIARELYDLQIEFVGQHHDRVGYTDATRDVSLWSTDGLTAGNSRCGSETWTAAIPWTDLSGVFTSVTDFNNGSTTIDNDDPNTSEPNDYYVFIGELNITAKEKLVAYSVNSPRTWEEVRTATWRYPFALKWQRDVYVEHDLQAFVCLDSHTICTIRHVTAIISFIQTNVNPIANLQSNEVYGVVVLGIKTKVAYPYMFVTGNATDDPPNDQISQSAAGNSGGAWAQYTSMFSNWAPPVVVARPYIVDGVQQSVTAVMAFQWEDTASCTHDTSQAVEYQTDNECEQNWAITITPDDSQTCYVNGNYTIYFSGRCVYDKPVCNFNADSNGVYANGVTTTLEVTSTQMCPSLVQNVDLTGYLCSTGRAIDELSYYTACDDDDDGDSSYIQGETTHFIAEIASELAAINKTEIIQIKATQDFSTWNTQDAQNAGLVPRFDSTYSDTVLLWQEGEALPKVLAWNPDDNGVSVSDTLLETIMDVSNSDDAGQTFSSNKVGFQVNLNPYIFPAPHDRHTDITFTVVLRVTYEGFNGFDRSTGVVSDDSFGGSEDHSWCAAALANNFQGDTTAFCRDYPEATTYCPDTCSRRQLKQRLVEISMPAKRRNLQTTVIEDGDDYTSLSSTIRLNPSKAEINGHVDDTTADVRFTLKMTIPDSHMSLWNSDRPLYYSRMEYNLEDLASAVKGQFKCDSVRRITRGQDEDAFEVVVDIYEVAISDPDLAAALRPYQVAQNLEMMIQTGQLYHHEFFKNTEVYEMEYESAEEDPDKVHFGELDGLSDTDVSISTGIAGGSGMDDSSASVLSLVVLFTTLFLW